MGERGIGNGRVTDTVVDQSDESLREDLAADLTVELGTAVVDEGAGELKEQCSV